MSSDDTSEFDRLLDEAVELHIASEQAFKVAREIDHRASVAWDAAFGTSGMKKSTDFADVFVGRLTAERTARETEAGDGD